MIELQRPRPPREILELDPYGRFAPALEVDEWIRSAFLDPESKVYNGDHQHLEQASIGFLWTSAECTAKGRTVIGMAERPSFRCNKWQKARQERQIVDWFDGIPDFLVTLDAHYCADCSDVEFLALVEHELYHCAQAEDEFGSPRFNQQTGIPVWTIRGHDVEEFTGVVRRYGVVSDEVRDLVIAAANKPEVSKLNVSRACGTCSLKSA